MHTIDTRLPLFCALLVMLLLMALGFLFEQPPPVSAQGTPTPSTPSPTPCAVLPGFSEGFESGTLGRFVSAVATCVPGGCGWSAATSATHTGSYSAFSPDVSNVADQRLTLVTAVAIPASGPTGANLTFWHRYSFEGSGSSNFDGGVLEISTNYGATWSDAASLMSAGGYNGFISSSISNPLAGRLAWVQVSPGYPSFYLTTVNLLSFAGKSVLIRFRQGDDSSVGAVGWWIDDVQVSINGCFRQELPLIKAQNSNGQDTSNTDHNPVLRLLQSLWNTLAGLFQGLTRTAVTR